MKKILLIAAAMVMAAGAYAQGTLNFSNRVTASGIDAPIFAPDGTTKLAGSQYKAVLFVNGSTTPVAGVAADFRTGAGAGYFIGQTVTLTGVAAGSSVSVIVGAFDSSTGADYASAKIKGQSGAINVTTGGAGAPPSLPADLVGLKSFNVQVPEPTTIALGVLGAAALLLRRRK